MTPVTKDITKLKKKADTWFSKYVRYRDGQVKDGEWVANCITCGTEKPIKLLQAGHFVSRNCNPLRYEDMNVHAQCVGCNMFKQGEQYAHAREIDELYGSGTAETLHNQRHQTKKWTSAELEQIITDAKEYIKELEEL
jgi:hypothetical protein